MQAETDAIFDAAAALIDAAPRRARPSSCRAEKDKASATTSKSPIFIEAACNHVQQQPSSGGMRRRRKCGCRTLELQHSAVAGTIRCRASALRRGDEQPKAADLANIYIFLIQMACEALLYICLGVRPSYR